MPQVVLDRALQQRWPLVEIDHAAAIGGNVASAHRPASPADLPHVKRIEQGEGAQEQGQVSFRWAGETDTGHTAPAGRYTVSAQYFNGVDMQSAATVVNAAVESVTFGAGGLSVRLRGLGEVPFSAVREIGQTP